MGSMHSQEFATMEEDGQINLTQAMTYQLRSNFYPPYPSEMIPVAVAAIEAFRDGDPEKLIYSPYEHREYGKKIPAHALIRAFKLWPWVEGY